MILTIHNHVITRIPRFTISHDKHYTWSLKITNVQQEDKGHYMCQVNTDPMVSKVGYLDVVGKIIYLWVNIFLYIYLFRAAWKKGPNKHMSWPDMISIFHKSMYNMQQQWWWWRKVAIVATAIAPFLRIFVGWKHLVCVPHPPKGFTFRVFRGDL